MDTPNQKECPNPAEPATAEADDPPARPMLRVVSVSLGSSKRNKTVVAEMLGQPFSIERVGVDGDFNRACEMIRELDGKVAAIGLGGTDLYLVAGGKRYVIEQTRRLAESAKATPVVDGSGLKNTLERETVRWLAVCGGVDLARRKVLVVSAVDRFGMAEAFAEAGCETVFGDLIFALGLPVPVRSLKTIERLAAVLLPVLRRLPIKVLYPSGKEQERTEPKHGRYFKWADVIAGDFHFIRRHLPERLDGKIIVTNTTTEEDVALLKERGLDVLVTTTPELHGRSFGTNVMEGVLIALANKRPEAMRPEDYMRLLYRLGWQPNMVRLQAPPEPPEPSEGSQ